MSVTRRSPRRAALLPALSVYTAGSQRYGLSFDETAGQLTQQRTEALQIGGQAEWTVYDGGARQAGLAQARAELASVEMAASARRRPPSTT